MSQKKEISDKRTEHSHSRRTAIEMGLASLIGLSSCGGGGSDESAASKVLTGVTTGSTNWTVYLTLRLILQLLYCYELRWLEDFWLRPCEWTQ